MNPFELEDHLEDEHNISRFTLEQTPTTAELREMHFKLHVAASWRRPHDHAQGA